MGGGFLIFLEIIFVEDRYLQEVGGTGAGFT